MNLLTIISSACPLLLCAVGALFTEFAGVLALFIEGLLCFSGFLTYAITLGTKSIVLGITLTCIINTILIFIFALLVEKFNANSFISGLALNLIFGACTSLFSNLIFGTQGVLTSENFNFDVTTIKIITICFSFVIILLTIFFLRFTKPGLYLRITGSDSEVLTAKGVKPELFRILSWCLAAFFTSFAGSFLVLRISSYVPNISSGRGWMALAAVYLGKKKTWKITISVLIFCAADIFSSSIQSFIPAIPSSLLLSLPYLIMILLIFIPSTKKR